MEDDVILLIDNIIDSMDDTEDVPPPVDDLHELLSVHDGTSEAYSIPKQKYVRM